MKIKAIKITQHAKKLKGCLTLRFHYHDWSCLNIFQVYVLKENRSVPIITGVISMPVSETMVVV